MIHAHDVSKWFGSSAGRIRAVSDVNLRIEPGQVVGLLGPNGAGKTTTIRMITGFLPPSAGTIEVGGHDTIEESAAARRLIGYLPDAAPLYPEMRVEDYLWYRGGLYSMNRADLKAARERVLERCWLREVRRQRVGTLSKGFRQRVGLAAALLHDPPVLILDEPISGLDPAQIRETRALVRELAGKHTVLVSSHILQEVEKTCDRIVIIVRGTVRADGSPDELLRGVTGGGERAAVEVEAKLSGADIEAAKRALAAIAGVKAVRGEPASSGGWWKFKVQPGDGADLREPVARALVQQGASIRELTRGRASLEDLFLRLIEEDHVGGAAGGVAA